ncbi:hypothetical protein B9Z35_00315 [Limnohabitans sp. Jir61]|jgi:predicted Fe-S protein YdhL (DUF1289 family)|uniref:DUF1289 domain-containing protein n=1 Tax=Limnohabitans sp. Jir61 TaxID=1826168 RepID=UPI000D3D9B66|nr:DUF1289 domain-containing protein [Limnohabitans sp. Jir61]PUE33119.1 hypothetical protein B9Z35_00315 [Limnohabitans sp. Jir61]
MCGSELTPKPQGLTPADLRLVAQAKRVLQSNEVLESPCISICRMSDDTTYCEGCWRTLDEIGGWGQRNADEKRVVWQLISERLAAHGAT